MDKENLNISVRIDPENINVFNKIIEGYDNLALVTAIEPINGKLLVRVTPDTKKDTLSLLKRLPFSVEILSEH
ncbi:MAG: DUF4911 domain-containing protein [Dehalobacterium sp.]|jgi:hypothetical protein